MRLSQSSRRTEPDRMSTFLQNAARCSGQGAFQSSKSVTLMSTTLFLAFAGSRDHEMLTTDS